MSVVGHSPRPVGDTGGLVRATNAVRERVVRTLAAYLELSATARECAEGLDTQVLHTAARLYEVVTERARLEVAYLRLRDRAERGGFRGVAELADAIRAAMAVAGDAPADTGAAARAERDFRRLVLPRVHEDTGPAPHSALDVAYAALRDRDHTVMAAFVVECRGVVSAAGDDGRPLTEDELATRLSDYRDTEQRLDDRCAELCAELTGETERDPADARRRVAHGHEELRGVVSAEAERVAELRRLMAALLGSTGNTGLVRP